MEDKLIDFETAKLAKKKGFNELVYNGYNLNKDKLNFDIPCQNSKNIVISAPTQSLLQKWLREEPEILTKQMR